jgi:mono/diheme cytochrome c family protein
MVDDDTTSGFVSRHRLDLIVGEDRNFRPVDMEFAPDGSLYFIDWHNVLIGHMQHNARDPYRDHVHGRVYRVTYPSRPLVTPAKVYGASIDELLDNLKLPEYRTRYRTRRELRSIDASEVLSKLKTWVAGLDKNDERYEHHKLEALWVTWGLNQIDKDLLMDLLKAKDFRARAAAVRVLRYGGHQIPNQPELLMQAVKDENPRVRLEALVAASWLDKEIGLPIVEEAGNMPLDSWMTRPREAAIAFMNGHNMGEDEEKAKIKTHLGGGERKLYITGKEIYEREGHCGTCHQLDGKGLEAAGFPPIAGTKWTNGSKERLIKLALNGLMGPIEVLGKKYPGQVPMTQFGGLLNDEELAAVLTYARNSFGNKSSVIYARDVKEVRESISGKQGFYSPEELLMEHPH